jgi:hypothetical protein
MRLVAELLAEGLHWLGSSALNTVVPPNTPQALLGPVPNRKYRVVSRMQRKKKFNK